MVEDLKKILLMGIGSAAYTYEKAAKIVEDMVEKGRITLDEGKELTEELKRNIKSKVEKKEKESVTRSEFEALKARIENLEKTQSE